MTFIPILLTASAAMWGLKRYQMVDLWSCYFPGFWMETVQTTAIRECRYQENKTQMGIALILRERLSTSLVSTNSTASMTWHYYFAGPNFFSFSIPLDPPQPATLTEFFKRIQYLLTHYRLKQLNKKRKVMNHIYLLSLHRPTRVTYNNRMLYHW